jgi:hypothetical protein
MRDIVEDYWASLSDEERAKFENPSPEELEKQEAETAAFFNKMIATPGMVSAVAQPQYLVPTTIGPDEPPMQPMTIFLDGLIKRPMSDELNLGCAWCEVSVRIPFPRDNRATDWMHTVVPEGWHLVEAPADCRYMCPLCVETEIPE